MTSEQSSEDVSICSADIEKDIPPEILAQMKFGKPFRVMKPEKKRRTKKNNINQRGSI